MNKQDKAIKKKLETQDLTIQLTGEESLFLGSILESVLNDIKDYVKASGDNKAIESPDIIRDGINAANIMNKVNEVLFDGDKALFTQEESQHMQDEYKKDQEERPIKGGEK